MSEQTDQRSIGKRANELNATIRYTMWSVFRLARPLGRRAAHRRADEVQALLDELAGKDVVVRGDLRRGRAAGRRRPHGLVARRDPEALQEAYTRLRRTALGPAPGARSGRRWRCTGRRSSTAATSRRSWPTRSRAATSASTRSCGPTSGTCCPTRSAGRCSPSTGAWRADYPDVRANTVASFALGDYEWMLAFEADELHRIVDLMRELRASSARRHVREEVPFYTGVRKPIAELVADLPPSSARSSPGGPQARRSGREGHWPAGPGFGGRAGSRR
jgi:chlorite dismutase